jgi:hypothetical protein
VVFILNARTPPRTAPQRSVLPKCSIEIRMVVKLILSMADPTLLLNSDRWIKT